MLNGESDTSLAGQRVLVTGGSGFVGRTLVAEFRRAGADVVVVDHRPFPGPSAGEITLVEGDLLDPAVLDRDRKSVV